MQDTRQDTREAPLRPVAAPAQPSPPLAPSPPRKKLTAREQRRKRRKARKRGEEILAWILVPVILLGIYLGVMAVLDFFGTDPGTVWDQLKQVKQMLEKKM